MEQQFRKDPVSPNEESTIILGIYAHGLDLCNTRLSEHHEKTLVFSMANKGCVYTDNIERQYAKVIHLATELNQKKRNIFEVFNDFENKCKTDTDTDFNLYDKSNHDELLKRDDLFIHNMDLNMQFEKMNTGFLLKEHPEKENEIKEEFLKNMMKHKIEKENKEKNKQHSINFIESCDKNYVAKPRHINIDRSYNINGGDPFNIYVFDIRRPKTEDQNNVEQIITRLNEKKEITLSELLKICYDELHFDYVSIVDFACRCNSDGTCDVDCPSSATELKEGRELMGTYQSKNLGGKKEKEGKKEKGGKKQTKRKKQKKRKQTRK